jgi:LCP family protein required for cell wall assembly
MPVRTRSRRLARAATLVAVALLLLAALVAVAAYWQADALVSELQAGEKRAIVEAVRPELDVPPRRPAVRQPPGPAKTILLVGSDARWGDPSDRRSDTIMLARVDPAAKRIALLSVPRDLLVEIPGDGRERVNVAYELGGVALLTRTVREALGVEINHFVEVQFRGFRQLVTELGGIYLPVDGRYLNRNRGTPETNFAAIDLRPGYQRLDGEQALAFVRFRHTDSDLHRAARQQLFLREAVRQLHASRYDVFKLRRLLKAFAKATTSDLDRVAQLWRLLRTVEEAPASRLARFTIAARETVLHAASYLTAGDEQIRRTVAAWHTAPLPGTPRRSSRKGAPGRPALRPALVPDGARGVALAKTVGAVARCAPTRLPPGFWWPEDEPARRYRLAGRPAAAFWATRGSGSSILWTMTTWADAPTLADPTSTIRRGGRTYELWFENRRLRQIAWQERGVRIWITNTLGNELGVETMLRLADSCRPR